MSRDRRVGRSRLEESSNACEGSLETYVIDWDWYPHAAFGSSFVKK